MSLTGGQLEPLSGLWGPLTSAPGDGSKGDWLQDPPGGNLGCRAEGCCGGRFSAVWRPGGTGRGRRAPTLWNGCGVCLLCFLYRVEGKEERKQVKGAWGGFQMRASASVGPLWAELGLGQWGVTGGISKAPSPSTDDLRSEVHWASTTGRHWGLGGRSSCRVGARRGLERQGDARASSYPSPDASAGSGSGGNMGRWGPGPPLAPAEVTAWICPGGGLRAALRLAKG